ncbi:MAG: TIGR02206 family membrane protein [Planctomycetota bacterium]
MAMMLVQIDESPPSPDPLHDFWMFSPVHLAVVLIAAGLIAGLCSLGVRWRTTPKETALLQVWGGVIVVSQATHMAWWCLPAQFKLSNSLPLQLCDLAGVVAAIAILTRARWARTMIVFWGILLSSWGFITPVLRQGPAEPIFWMFWVNHLAIVGTAVYEIVAARYRPTKTDTLAAIGVSFGYVVAMVVLNTLEGETFNFGYVGAEGVDPINLLGPYPWRLIPLSIGVAALMWGFGVLLRQFGPEHEE